MDMVLAKTDIAIAARYADPGRRPRAARATSSRRIDDEFRRTRQALLAITGPARLPRAQPARCARSIRDRLPYLDPLNHLQLELLHRYRGGRADERVRRALHLTINGIAAGPAQQRLSEGASVGRRPALQGLARSVPRA